MNGTVMTWGTRPKRNASGNLYTRTGNVKGERTTTTATRYTEYCGWPVVCGKSVCYARWIENDSLRGWAEQECRSGGLFLDGKRVGEGYEREVKKKTKR